MIWACCVSPIITNPPLSHLYDVIFLTVSSRSAALGVEQECQRPKAKTQQGLFREIHHFDYHIFSIFQYGHNRGPKQKETWGDNGLFLTHLRKILVSVHDSLYTTHECSVDTNTSLNGRRCKMDQCVRYAPIEFENIDDVISWAPLKYPKISARRPLKTGLKYSTIN